MAAVREALSFVSLPDVRRRMEVTVRQCGHVLLRWFGEVSYFLLWDS